MTEVTRLDLPATREALDALSVGDAVELFGPAYTARDATHARLLDDAEAAGELPFDLFGQALFYAGPTPAAAGRPAGAIGPTTAKRMDAFTPRMLELGVAVTIGKGPRSPEVAAACAEHGAVYLAAVGGAAALSATKVVALEPVAYPELGTEALLRVVFEGFLAFVAVDARGADLFAQMRETGVGAP